MTTNEHQAEHSTPRPRRYNSTLRQRRAEETRERIINAATELFAQRGWSVGMREIAAEAGVAFDTVYATFKSKSRLLNEVLDVGVVGDTRPIALADRPEFAALATGTLRERAAAGAALTTAVNVRTTGLRRALAEGAASDPDLALRLDAGRRAQRRDVYEAGAAIAGRELTPDEGDGLWAVVTMEVYDLLTTNAGWSAKRYEKWLTEMILKLLTIE
ncbi:TetR family transcriptional regulator [Gordonia sp. CPCC 205515]|uniref:TetR/AcrR family transcriptional regulator n=1 Tax=Gordonia sp. CPCC 205515 TaxID=3140791 RepID=UPI003AF3E04F